LSDACLAPQGTKRLQPVIDFSIPPQGLKSGGIAFVPTDISDLKADWNPIEENLTFNGPVDVSEFTDDSGLGNTLAQIVATAQPTWIETDANYNNKPTLDFPDTADENMWMNVWDDANEADQPNTIIIVGNFKTGAHGNVLCSGDAAFSRHEISQIGGNQNSYAGASNSGTSGYNTSPQIWSVRFDGDPSDYRRSGTLEKSGNVGTQNCRGFVLSGGNTHNGGRPSIIARVLFYNRKLTDSEMNQIGNWASTEYGITWSDI